MRKISPVALLQLETGRSVLLWKEDILTFSRYIWYLKALLWKENIQNFILALLYVEDMIRMLCRRNTLRSSSMNERASKVLSLWSTSVCWSDSKVLSWIEALEDIICKEDFLKVLHEKKTFRRSSIERTSSMGRNPLKAFSINVRLLRLYCRYMASFIDRRFYEALV